MRPEQYRFKTADLDNKKEWQCCICLHVRTATILLGTWHMLLHFLAIFIMVCLLNNPQLLVNDQITPPRSMATQNHFVLDDKIAIEIEQREISQDILEYGPTHKPNYEVLRRQMIRYTDIQSGLLITLLTLMVTMALVMGAVKGKASLLMPFFCFQLFDFCIGGLAAISYLAVLPDMHRLITDNGNIPFQKVLLDMNSECLTLVMILAFVLAMFIKGYFIRVVWKCYKFLVLKESTRHHSSIHVIEAPFDSQNLLPDYEAAVNKYQAPPVPPPSYDIAVAPVPPPSYCVAMANAVTVPQQQAVQQPTSVRLPQ